MPRPPLMTLLILALTTTLLTPALTPAAMAGQDPGQALRDAASRGDIATVRELLDRGVDPNAANRYGATALSFAAAKGHLEIARFLIEKGADVNVSDRFYQMTPLVGAAYEGHAEVVAFLAANGAEGAEATMAMAISRGAMDTAKALIDHADFSAEQLTRMWSQASRVEDAQPIAALLQQAGAKPPPPTGFELPAAALERFAGPYQTPDGSYAVNLEITEGFLTAHFPPNPPIPLEPTAAAEFRPRGGNDFTVVFGIEGEAVKGFRYDGQGQSLDFVRPAAAASPSAAAGEQAPRRPKPTQKATAGYGGAAKSDWPAFRGPGAAGTAQGTPPLEWDAPADSGVRFKAPIPGRAHSSPIVWQDRIYLTSAVSSAEEGEFRYGLYGDVDSAGNTARHEWRLMALDRQSGEIVWQRTAHAGAPRSDNHIKATQANATPVTDGQRVVAMMGSEGLFAYAMDGELLWRRDLGSLDVGWFYDPTYQWGHASSPVIFGDSVIVQVDRHGDPFIAAYALADGEELWRTKRDNLPSWGTPALVPAGDGYELVTNGAEHIRAYDPGSGEELWRLGPNSEITVGTPVTGHGLVFITGGYPPIRPIYAVRPGGRGDISPKEGEKSAHLAWWTETGGTYMPTPIVYGDHLYMLANNGVLTCYRAADGERLYRTRVAGRGGVAFSASPVAAAGRLYLASEDGDVYVVAAGEEFELLATNPMGEITMATPAIADDVIYVRTLGHLYALGAPPAEPAAAP